MRAILQDSGWNAIEITALDIECRIARDQLPTYVSLLGPVGQALRADDLAPAARTRILQAVVDAFAPFIRADEVVFNAACWSIRAG